MNCPSSAKQPFVTNKYPKLLVKRYIWFQTWSALNGTKVRPWWWKYHHLFQVADSSVWRMTFYFGTVTEINFNLGLGQQFSSLPNYARVVLKLHCFIFPRLSPLSGCVARPSVSMLCWRWSPSDWRLERLSHISASRWRLYTVQWTVHCTASVHRPRVPMINSFNFTSFPVDGGQCGHWSRVPALSKLSTVRTVRTAGCISVSHPPSTTITTHTN